LQVTVKATAATGLTENDVFYFGNAVGESLDSDAVTFVDGTDFAGARDHGHNFLDRAARDDAYDYNRDSFVDGSDLAIARDNNTNFLTCLDLITAPPLNNDPSSDSPTSAGIGETKLDIDSLLAVQAASANIGSSEQDPPAILQVNGSKSTLKLSPVTVSVVNSPSSASVGVTEVDNNALLAGQGVSVSARSSKQDLPTRSPVNGSALPAKPASLTAPVLDQEESLDPRTVSDVFRTWRPQEDRVTLHSDLKVTNDDWHLGIDACLCALGRPHPNSEPQFAN